MSASAIMRAHHYQPSKGIQSLVLSNGDALDLESCKNALIINNIFDAGDDAICIKSGKDEDGRKRGEPCQNVIVKNNTVLHGHGGFVVGSEMSGGVKTSM